MHFCNFHSLPLALYHILNRVKYFKANNNGTIETIQSVTKQWMIL